MSPPEVLAPAGSLNKLKTAVSFGADAVYIGGTQFGLRKQADNFSRQEMEQGIAYAHRHGAKVYVVLNGFPHVEDMPKLDPYLDSLNALKPDAFIISDLGVFTRASERTNIPLHISTQASVMNWRQAAFWQERGAKRIVVGREVSLDECREIKEHVDVEIEAFVHGSMCTSNSGKCVISNYTAGRDANRGGCNNACRFPFEIIDEATGETQSNTTVMNSKDLMAVTLIPEFIQAGVDSLKIEGRMKSEMYVANCAQGYRKAVDHCLEGEPDPSVLMAIASGLGQVSNRQFNTGSLVERAFADSLNMEFEGYRYGVSFMAQVKSSSGSEAILNVREYIEPGDQLEAHLPSGDVRAFTLSELRAMNGDAVGFSHPNRLMRVNLPFQLPELTIIRKPLDQLVYSQG